MSVNNINTTELFQSDMVKFEAKVAAKPVEVEQVTQSEKTISLSKTEKTTKADTVDDESKAVDMQVLADAVETITSFVNMPTRSVNFAQDVLSEKMVIKVFDSENDELIRQFPSEEILLIAQRIVEFQQDVSKKTGILLDEKV